MRKKSLSTLGYLMEQLNIQTVSMARSLHVDASLVSKWKTGDRTLSARSMYFDDVVAYLIEQSESDDYQSLKNALSALHPQEDISDLTALKQLLLHTLAKSISHPVSAGQKTLFDNTNATETIVFEGNNGRREAITRLLDYAESMTTPGELLFIDSEEYQWLLENKDFSDHFIERITKLLKRGFHAKFVLHYSTYRERFIRLFDVCSLLIFHRNVEWYSSKYYDESIFQFSFFILNKAISLLGISSGNANSTTMVFTENSLVLRHELVAKNAIDHCNRLFTDYDFSQLTTVIDNIFSYRKKSHFFAFLPAPAFFTAHERLLSDILRSNQLSDQQLKDCVALNEKILDITSSYFSKKSEFPQPFIYIFQLEEMIKRAKTTPFYSNSLTIIADTQIEISQEQYATELRKLADGLIKHSNLQIILVSEKDGIPLPSINCWCKQNEWMVQMDQYGFRLGDEISFVNATSSVFEHCIQKVPPERKEKEPVRQFLLELADEICGEYS